MLPSPVWDVLAYSFISIFFSPSICPFCPPIYPQVLQQLSQHALFSRCGFEPVQRYTTHSWLLVMSHISFSSSFIFCYSPPALFCEPVSSSCLSVPSGPDLWGTEVTSDLRPRALSVIAVRPELDTLYKKMNEQNRGEGLGADECV